jgi:hypothetical protein
MVRPHCLHPGGDVRFESGFVAILCVPDSTQGISQVPDLRK